MYVPIYIHIYMHIHIYRERERYTYIIPNSGPAECAERLNKTNNQRHPNPLGPSNAPTGAPKAVRQIPKDSSRAFLRAPRVT